MYAVILAGGGGTRLWPLSTPDIPKPFLPLLGPCSLLSDTVRRLLDGDELGLRPEDVTIVADARYADLVEREAPGVRFLPEPAARNTAAAIALAAAHIDRPKEEVMLVLPADHAVARPARFRSSLRLAGQVAAAPTARGGEPPLVTLGVAPDRPATEYGYLIPAWTGPDVVTRLEAFEEKPTPSRARELLALPGVAWNAGIFLWRRDAIIRALARWAPDIWLEASRRAPTEGTYSQVRSTSIDYAVMEAAAAIGGVVSVQVDCGWNDVGTWSALFASLGVTVEAEVLPAGTTVTLEAADLLVRRARGVLGVETGPGTFSGLPGPVAVLRDARAERLEVDSLIHRVGRAARPLPAMQAMGGGS